MRTRLRWALCEFCNGQGDLVGCYLCPGGGGEIWTDDDRAAR
jgi:hypothetical protein